MPPFSNSEFASLSAGCAHVVQNAIGHVAHGFFEYVAQVAAGSEIGRSKEIHSVLVCLQIVALAETGTRGVIRVVHRYAQAALLAHDGKAGDICRTVPQVNHVLEGNGAQVAVHVVVHVFRVFYHALVDTEEELSFGCM